MKAYIGKHVEFNEEVEKIECGFDPKMRSKIVAVEPHQDFWKFYFDFSYWEEYNKQFSQPNWYDKDNIASLRWYEVGPPLYPSNKIETVYLDTTDCFDVIQEPENKVDKLISLIQESIKNEEISENFCSDSLRNKIENMFKK